jgi:hypothetical protein
MSAYDTAGGCAAVSYALISYGLVPLSDCGELAMGACSCAAARRRRHRRKATRPTRASPPTTPPTMPPMAPPERPDDEASAAAEAVEVLLAVLDAELFVVVAVEAVEAVEAPEAPEADEVAGSAVVLVEGSKSASLMGRAVAEGLAERSDEYVLLNRSLERFATGFGDVLQQMLIWSLVWVHASLSRTR